MTIRERITETIAESLSGLRGEASGPATIRTRSFRSARSVRSADVARSLMLGYFDDQCATESAFNAHGWFMTGDLGRLDEDGYLRVTGRKKDLIIRGGHNIYPAQIENLSMHHPAVSRAAALPVPDPRLGEKVCIAVMLRPGSRIDADELLAPRRVGLVALRHARILPAARRDPADGQRQDLQARSRRRRCSRVGASPTPVRWKSRPKMMRFSSPPPARSCAWRGGVGGGGQLPLNRR